MSTPWWKQRRIRKKYGSLKWLLPDDHIHLSCKKLEKVLKHARDGYGAAPVKPLRTHTDGWPDRPAPERPDRGRNSQEPNKKPKRRRGVLPGDLVAFVGVRLHGDRVVACDGKCYSHKCKTTAGGPFIYVGSEECDDYDIHDKSNQDEVRHILLFGSTKLRCRTSVLTTARILSRVDKAVG